MLSLLLPVLASQAISASDADVVDSERSPTRVEIVEVRSTAQQITQGGVIGISLLDTDQIDLEGLTHPNELFDRVPGAWISRGSGQESLTAIRSPILTGPGACGAFMVIENRVPIRPAGFCNVNELFEVNLLQAQRVEIVRGPGSAIYGSNALHGVMDITGGQPDDEDGWSAGLMMGSDDYYRGRLEARSNALSLDANYVDSRSFREEEGFSQAFINLGWSSSFAGADVLTKLSWADLDQETAGFIFGKDAYKDPELRTGNVNPEAFRKVSALRITSQWRWFPGDDSQIELIPYLRSSDMDFLQHFLPGKPLETNGQDSAGLLFSWTPGSNWSLGADVEWADGDLTEFQANPTQGSAFLMETRPQGFHYDYSVRMLMLAGWAQWNQLLSDNWSVNAGLRAEVIDYDYDNFLLDGNTRDDGTECGFGGCLYTRPADRSDSFTNLAPELGLSWSASDSTTLSARIARGFRPPQATELYRLQRGQTVADLNSETLDSLELGVRSIHDNIEWDVTAFAMRKDNVIFRDANGFNVSDGETDHVGLEASIIWQVAEALQFSANASWTQHEYAFDRASSGIVDGNTVDTAPEWLAGARLLWDVSDDLSTELEWVHMDEYFLDPGNQHSYEGHDLLNLRVFYTLPGSQHRFALRVSNLLDDLYAERGDFAFGNYRYFPGAERRMYLEWRFTP